MNHRLALLAAFLIGGEARAAGILIPTDKKLPPFSLVKHTVTAAIEEQVAVTTVEQTFRNHTDRDLEATYLFPIPKGASVNKFTMWVDGKETSRRTARQPRRPARSTPTSSAAPKTRACSNTSATA